MKNSTITDSAFDALLGGAKKLDYTGYSEQYPPVGAWATLKAGAPMPLRAWKRDRLHASSFNLFVNFPFCRVKCDFCFLPVTAIGRGAQSAVDAYLDCLEREAAIYSAAVSGRRCRTLYIGGGTPSLMTPRQVDRFFSVLRSAFDLSGPDQVSLEIHPENAGPGVLRAFAANGVNWACVGVQSLDLGVLRTARRSQRLQAVKRAVLALRAAGIPGVNLDLICGLPGQDRDMFFSDVNAAAAMRPDEIHLNVFMDTPYTGYALRGGQKIDGEAVQRLRDSAFARLRPLGYRRIDSDAAGLTPRSRNFQTADLSGKKSILGLGPGSVSRAWGAARYINTVSWREYGNDLAGHRAPVRLGVVTTPADEMAYYVMDKLTYGRRRMSFAGFRRTFGADFSRALPGATAALAAAGIERDGDGLKAGSGRWLAVRKALYSPSVIRSMAVNLRRRRAPGSWPP